MTRGSTPATALATNRPSGSAPSSAALSALAITSAAAPSLMPLELPAVTVPSGRKAGFSAASFSRDVSGTRVLVAADVADRDELVVEAARLGGGRVPALALEREGVLVLAGDAEPLGDVLPGLAHRLEREHRLQAWVGEAPAEGRVPGGLVAAREGVLWLSGDEGRPRHRLRAAGHEELPVARAGPRGTRIRPPRAPRRTAG